MISSSLRPAGDADDTLNEVVFSAMLLAHCGCIVRVYVHLVPGPANVLERHGYIEFVIGGSSIVRSTIRPYKCGWKILGASILLHAFTTGLYYIRTIQKYVLSGNY